jgi:hypothetical protein
VVVPGKLPTGCIPIVLTLYASPNKTDYGRTRFFYGDSPNRSPRVAPPGDRGGETLVRPAAGPPSCLPPLLVAPGGAADEARNAGEGGGGDLAPRLPARRSGGRSLRWVRHR